MARPPDPTLLTADTQERIVNAIQAGNRLDVAAAYAGIHRDTLMRWLRAGRKRGAKEPFLSFAAAIDKALAACQVTLVARVNKAGIDDWKADAWLLERRFPTQWGLKQAVRLEVAKALEELSNASDAELLSLAGIGAEGAAGSLDPGAEGSED